MEQCLGDQQFVTLLLNLENICIFAPDISAMLDWIELVVSFLKEFQLKMKPSADGISANPERVDK